MKRTALLILLVAMSLSPAAGATARGPRAGNRLRVAFVTDVLTPASPRDLRGDAYIGFLRAVRDFHVQGRVFQYDPKEGVAATLTSLARLRYDLVFTGEINLERDFAAFSKLAPKFPHTKFLMDDAPYQLLTSKPRNVEGSVWRVEQPSYLAGYLAALMEQRRPGRDVVGVVGGYPVSPVDMFIAGFRAGAKAADPRITVLIRYAQSFLDTTKCRATARSEIAAGAGVLFNVAGACGLGTLAAAKTAHVWGIGVDVDQSFLGPYILTSVLKRGDVEVYTTIEALVRGRLVTGGNSVWDVRNGAVGLGKISSTVPRAFLTRLDRVRRQIASGQIRVPMTLTR